MGDAIPDDPHALLESLGPLGSYALRDSLTGLPSRRLLEALTAAHPAGPAGLILVGIQALGETCRRHGCEGGDAVLKAVADLLRYHSPETAHLARFSFDAFAVFLPGASETETTEQVRRFEAAVTEGGTILRRSRASLALASAWHPATAGELVATVEARRCSGAPDPLAGLVSGDWGRDLRNVSLLLETLEASNALVDPETILAQVVDWTIELSGTERGLLLLDDGAGVRQRIARDRHKQPLDDGLPHSTTVVESVMRTGEAVALSSEDGLEWAAGRSVADLGLISVLCVPIRARSETHVRGVLYVDGQRQSRFTPDDVQFFCALARQLCSVLERARLQAEVVRLADQLRRRLADTEAELGRARQEIAGRYAVAGIVSCSPQMGAVLELIDRVKDTDVPVLIVGESGTGKELVARALHHNGPRHAGPFVAENCGAFSETLLESELFGHRRGAFTGATADRVGLVARAEGGTLFLDEIGEMSLGLQKKLLRFLQEGTYRPVGASDPVQANVRILTATHRDLEAEIAAERFRPDLYYRINVVRIALPPLRDRRCDIPILTDHFTSKHAAALGREVPGIEQAAMDCLIAGRWPGNVRELENEIQRALVLSRGTLRACDLSPRLREAQPALAGRSGPLAETVASYERQLVEQALAAAGGNRSGAARTLGIPRTTLLDKLKKHGIG